MTSGNRDGESRTWEYFRYPRWMFDRSLELSPREREFLAFVMFRLQVFDSVTDSFRAIGEELGGLSGEGTKKVIDRLVDRGFLRNDSEKLARKKPGEPPGYRGRNRITLGRQTTAAMERVGAGLPASSAPTPPRSKDSGGRVQSRPLPPEAVVILDDLLHRTMHDDSPLFTTRRQRDSRHYSKTLKAFSDKLQAIHDGQFSRRYQFDPDYAERRIDPEAPARLRSVQGSWEALSALVSEAATNYAGMLEPDREPETKNHLHHCVSRWLFDEHRRESLFLESLAGPPPRVSEKVADRIWDTLPEAVVDIATPLLLDSWDPARFWRRIKSVVEWRKSFRREIVEADENAHYWFDLTAKAWLEKYVRYLKSFPGLRLSQIGTGNATWDSFLDRARSEHNISIDLGAIDG